MEEIYKIVEFIILSNSMPKLNSKYASKLRAALLYNVPIIATIRLRINAAISGFLAIMLNTNIKMNKLDNRMYSISIFHQHYYNYEKRYCRDEVANI